MGIENIDALKPEPEEPLFCERDSPHAPHPGCDGWRTIQGPTEEQERAELAYPHHSPEAALANYRAGREVWDTNGDLK